MNTDNNLTKTQELELLSSLESRAESPLKFGYIGEGYNNWIKIAQKSRENHELEFEEDSLKKESLPFIFREINKDTDTVNIIDFGCGDGVPMLPIFEYLNKLSIRNINYIPVDISQAMLDGATKNIKDDFFLLGNTIGNFDNTEKVLSNLKMSMFSDDHLIIGNQISNLINTAKIIQYYQDETKFNFFVRVLQNYGMKCEPQEYIARWNEKKKQIEGFLVLKEDKTITIADRTLKFEKGEEILLYISKKYIEESIVEMLNRAGFRIDLFTTNKKKDNCIISVSPTRYRS
jgi:uncharacterized SAM-dependent methyltransferase